MSSAGLSDSAQRYYIVAPEIPRPERTLVLKHGETFGLFNEFGDIDTRARQDEGLYHQGTRFLSSLTLSLAGGRPRREPLGTARGQRRKRRQRRVVPVAAGRAADRTRPARRGLG